MSADEILELTPRRRLRRESVPDSFRRFCAGIGVALYPGQEEIARVAFDCGEPESEIIWGSAKAFSDATRDVFVAVCGARAGKTYVLGALRLLHLACHVPLTSLAPGEKASGLIVAPDLRLARQCYRYVLGAAPQCAKWGVQVVAERAESIEIKRSDKAIVVIECLPATRGGGAVRGRSYVGAVLDECAFFRDANYAINDEEIYRAVEPRIVDGGQLVLCSTAYGKNGLLYNLWRENFGAPKTCMVAHAPTLVLRDDEHTRRYVERERQRDPENARREFDAEFMDSFGSAFFPETAVEACVDDSLELGLPVQGPHATGVGGDFGFRQNASALAITSHDADSMIRLRALEELLPGDEPLKPSAVVATFARTIQLYRGEFLVSDGHYRESVAEHLQSAELSFVPAPAGASGVSSTYMLTRTLMLEGRLRYPNHKRLVKQLKEVMSRPLVGGGVSIMNPVWKDGSHGDLVSALVLAVWDAYRKTAHMVPKEPEEGTKEWEDREDERLQRQILRNQRRRRGRR